MKVSGISVKYNNSFKSYPFENKDKPKEITKDDIRTAKIKKVVSELSYLAAGACLIYFGVKKSFKNTKLANEAKKLASKRQEKAPQVLDLFINKK